MDTLNIGIATYEEVRARTMAIAKGELKPSAEDPKVWFSSVESLAQVLSTKNRMLLEIIAEQSPSNLNELAELSGRQKSNLSRTLKTMQQYGLVELKPGKGKELVPSIPYSKLKLNFDLFENRGGHD